MKLRDRDTLSVRAAAKIAGIRSGATEAHLRQAAEREARILSSMVACAQAARESGAPNATLLAREARLQRARVETLKQGMYAASRLRLAAA